jgi:hypothetical protein
MWEAGVTGGGAGYGWGHGDGDSFETCNLGDFLEQCEGEAASGVDFEGFYKSIAGEHLAVPKLVDARRDLQGCRSGRL